MPLGSGWDPGPRCSFPGMTTGSPRPSPGQQAPGRWPASSRGDRGAERHQTHWGPREGKEMKQASAPGSPSSSCSCPPKRHTSKKRGGRREQANPRSGTHAASWGPLEERGAEPTAEVRGGRVLRLRGARSCQRLRHSSFLAGTRVRAMTTGTRARQPRTRAHRGR